MNNFQWSVLIFILTVVQFHITWKDWMKDLEDFNNINHMKRIFLVNGFGIGVVTSIIISFIVKIFKMS